MTNSASQHYRILIVDDDKDLNALLTEYLARFGHRLQSAITAGEGMKALRRELPDLVREVAAAGHEIGSHGYDHRILPELGAEGFRTDLQKTGAILQDLVGDAPRVFRACTWSITPRTRRKATLPPF